MENTLKIPLAEKDKEGFELIYRNNGFLFFYKDEDENILLQSEVFLTAKDRNTGIEVLLQNIQQENKVFFKKADDKLYYFIVKQNDDSTIARSVTFDTEDQAERALVIFKNKIYQLFQEQPQVSCKTAIIPTLQHDEELKENYKNSTPSRYSFRIDFYRSEDEKQLFGKLEYPLTKEKIHFKGLNKEKIFQFIQSKLPNESVDLVSVLRHQNKYLPAVPPVAADVPNTILGIGSSTNTPHTTKTRVCTVLMDKQLSKNNISQMEIFYDEQIVENCYVTIFAKSLTSPQYVELQANKMTKLDANKKMLIAFSTNPLDPGLYRLTVTTSLTNSVNPSYFYEGKSYVQIY